MRRLLRKLSGERGVSAVEFGLLLPLLLVILLGVIDYGWVFFVRLNMTNAAREGARVGVTRDDGVTAQTDATTAANNYLAAAGITGGDVVVTSTNPETEPNESVVVTVTYNNFPNHALVNFVPVPASMTVSAQMRWELAGP